MLELDKLGMSSSTQLYKGVEATLAVLNTMGLTHEDAMDVASTLLGVLTEDEDKPDSVLDDKRWHQLYPGSVKNGWLVRVKPHRFSDKNSKYNGMIGRIVHTSYGRAKINNVLMNNKEHYFNIDDLEYYL